MRVLITEKGATGPKGKRLEKGMEVEIDGDVLPIGLVNKCQVLAEGGKRGKAGKMIVNPASGANSIDPDLLAQAKELAIEGVDTMDNDALKAAVDAALAS